MDWVHSSASQSTRLSCLKRACSHYQEKYRHPQMNVTPACRVRSSDPTCRHCRKKFKQRDQRISRRDHSPALPHPRRKHNADDRQSEMDDISADSFGGNALKITNKSHPRSKPHIETEKRGWTELKKKLMNNTGKRHCRPPKGNIHMGRVTASPPLEAPQFHAPEFCCWYLDGKRKQRKHVHGVFYEHSAIPLFPSDWKCTEEWLSCTEHEQTFPVIAPSRLVHNSYSHTTHTVIRDGVKYKENVPVL